MASDTSKRSSYFLISPMALIFAVFLVIPLLTIVVVSFWDYDEYRILPDFIFENYEYLLGSSVTWSIYLNTLKYAVLTWFFTLVIGFTVAYFLAFHVRSLTWQIVLFMLCTIPFWTSNIIRMISWIPFLGRNGLLNSALINLGIVDQPLEFLLFSDFAVVLADVHLYALFMVVPIFNSMMRIDRSLVEAARDALASHQVELIDADRDIEAWQEELFQHVDAGLTSTRGGIAETGSLWLWPDADEPRLLSLVPPLHIAVLDVDAIEDTLFDVITHQGWASGMPTNALLISGPSKTADIEQVLAYGAHGPKELVVLILEDG